MASTSDIPTFSDDEPPAGETPWVVRPSVAPIDVVGADPSWPVAYAKVADRVRNALGARALQIEHVGSTAVPGLPAKPVIDVDLIVASSADEDAWCPALERAGFTLTVREPWWHEHRMLKLADPLAHLHVFSPDAPEPWKHRIFRDHLRRDSADRDLYAQTKREAAELATNGEETMMEYNARKQAVIRDIYARAFRSAGFAA
ncbi:MAG: GrpB family protein [Microbacterium gubbeenense]|uniref:GrpB family protein n=1 Tax=Microbacterium gubbeenense TaxID=159896 RepID=UPI003F9DF913